MRKALGDDAHVDLPPLGGLEHERARAEGGTDRPMRGCCCAWPTASMLTSMNAIDRVEEPKRHGSLAAIEPCVSVGQSAQAN